jgi:Transposase DDE domain
MIYDILRQAGFDFDALQNAFLDYQPAESETIASYEVYGLDATKNERAEAETLPERCALKSQKDDPFVYGHKYSWLVRLIHRGTSWVAPQDLLRIDPQLSDSQVGGQQVQELAMRNPQPKVVVEDSLYGNHIFLAIFLLIQNTFALVRMRGSNVLYEKPDPREPGKKGAPQKHGAKFQLSSPSRAADGEESFLLGAQQVTVQGWKGLHLKKLPELTVMLVRVIFLKTDGQPRYKQPMWLLWTGPSEVALQDLCKMYLWRFAIEHLFRFLKQNLGLNTSRSNDLVGTEQWMWLCALAYWQLLLMKDLVEDARPAWHSRKQGEHPKHLTPGQVQRAAFRYLATLGTPAKTPKRAGKGKGRAQGYRPPPRIRYPVIKKAKTAPKEASVSP